MQGCPFCSHRLSYSGQIAVSQDLMLTCWYHSSADQLIAICPPCPILLRVSIMTIHMNIFSCYYSHIKLFRYFSDLSSSEFLSGICLVSRLKMKTASEATFFPFPLELLRPAKPFLVLWLDWFLQWGEQCGCLVISLRNRLTKYSQAQWSCRI